MLIKNWWEAKGITSELIIVVSAIAQALGDRPPSPELIAGMASELRHVVPGHDVTIEHTPRSPKGYRPRLKASYKISIRGQRVDGQWGFTPGQLARLMSELPIHDRH